MNVALPSIRRDLGFSAQGLQWVLSGYLVTYGGLLLLGGRAGDLLGRRPLLVAGTAAVRRLLAGRRPGRRRGHAGRRPARAGRRRGDDGAGRAVDPDHQLQLRRRPQPGARRLGRDLRPGRGGRGVPRRRAVPGTGMAVGAVRQPAGLRADPLRRLPAGARRAARRPARGLRRPRRGPGHRRHAAAGLRPGPGAGAGLGQRPHDRGARHRGRPARRLHRHRAAPPRPAVPVLHLPRQGAGSLRCRADDRVRRVRVGVLLPHPLHAERPGLQPRSAAARPTFRSPPASSSPPGSPPSCSPAPAPAR